MLSSVSYWLVCCFKLFFKANQFKRQNSCYKNCYLTELRLVNLTIYAYVLFCTYLLTQFYKK